MTSTEPIGSPPPTFGDILNETDPLIGYIPVAGPPVLLVAVPWLLFALMLAGPFALLLTFVVLLVAATLLIGLAGVILASPYLLVRHLRGRRADHASISSPALQLVPVAIAATRPMSERAGRWQGALRYRGVTRPLSSVGRALPW